MTGSVLIDIVIGLVFFYLLYSLLATILQEIVATFWNFRAKMLERAIRRMLLDEENIKSRLSGTMKMFLKSSDAEKMKAQMEALKLTAKMDSVEYTELQQSALYVAFYEHPLIKFLGEARKGSKPSYLTKESFSKVILDLLKGNNIGPNDSASDKIETAIKTHKTQWEFAFGTAIIPPKTHSYLKSIWNDAQGDADKFRIYIEKWYEETMARTTGWYKKHTQMVLLVIGFIMAGFLNLDTIKVARKLNSDPKIREQMVQQAQAFIKEHPHLDKELDAEKKLISEKTIIEKNDTFRKLTKREKDSLNDLADTAYAHNKEMRDTLIARAGRLVNEDMNKTQSLLGLGPGTIHWSCPDDLLLSLIGWIITALAISLGAPFWFDLLNKFMQMRSSVTGSGDKKQDTKSTPPTK